MAICTTGCSVIGKKAKFDDPYVQEQIKGCEEFIEQIRPLIKTLAEKK